MSVRHKLLHRFCFAALMLTLCVPQSRAQNSSNSPSSNVSLAVRIFSDTEIITYEDLRLHTKSSAIDPDFALTFLALAEGWNESAQRPTAALYRNHSAAIDDFLSWTQFRMTSDSNIFSREIQIQNSVTVSAWQKGIILVLGSIRSEIAQSESLEYSLNKIIETFFTMNSLFVGPALIALDRGGMSLNDSNLYDIIFALDDLQHNPKSYGLDEAALHSIRNLIRQHEIASNICALELQNR